MQMHFLNKRRPSTIAQKDDDALGDYPRKFQAHLESQGYAPETVAAYGRRIRRLGTFMQEHKIAVGALSDLEAAELLSKVKWPSSNRQSTSYIVRHFVRFLIGECAIPPAPTPVATPTPKERARASLRQDYEVYLRRQRGLSEQTIHSAWRYADRFLDFRFGDDKGNASEITQTDIAGFMQHLHSRQQPYRVKVLSTSLRTFFQFLFKAGKTKINLALGIPSVAHRYGTRLPRHLVPAQVESLLSAVRSETPKNRRNYAMMILLARLGLRASEVVAMQIDDIDWRVGEIIIRGKGQLHDRVPLPQDVGEALADYIRLDRVTTSRALFVSGLAPHRPLKDATVLNAILKRAFVKTGLKTPAPCVGSRVLRHSLATNLLQRGASMEEIGNMLRHRARPSTMIYARLDIEGLRSIAQPWPVVGGAK